MRKFGLFVLACVAVLGLHGADLLKNGDFSKGADGGMPEGWHFSRSGSADGEMTRGGDGLKIVNRSKKAANVFLSLNQVFQAQPGVDYTLLVTARGEGALGVALGEGWKTRFGLTAAPEAQTFEFRFKLKDEQIKGGRAVLVLISEAPTAGLEITQIAVEESAARNLLANGSFDRGAPGKTPAGWTYDNHNKADASLTWQDGYVVLNNKTPRTSNVYGRLSQEPEYKAGVTYEFTGRIKGKSAKPLGVAIGHGWVTRFALNPTADWQDFRYTFTLKDEQVKGGRAPFVILTEDVGEDICLDDLVIREVK